jgi:hypothetical protein
MRGMYVTSTLAQRHTDTDKNVGFILRYRADTKGELVRRNTRALESGAANDEQRKDDAKKPDVGRFLAFKALPPRTSVPANKEDTPENEVELVKEVCDEIARVANKIKREDDDQGRTLEVEEKDIISVADAKKTTGYLEQFEYSLKKLVWG